MYTPKRPIPYFSNPEIVKYEKQIDEYIARHRLPLTIMVSNRMFDAFMKAIPKKEQPEYAKGIPYGVDGIYTLKVHNFGRSY